MKIAIIGGGVCGFGCAVRIKEAYPSFEVTIITKDVTPHTTGDGSAGLWTPYILGNTPAEKVLSWSSETHKFFHELWKQGLAGASLIPVLDLSTDASLDIPIWKDIAYGFQKLTEGEMRLWNNTFTMNYKSGAHYVTFTCEPTLLLPYLMERFKQAGGNIVKQEVESLIKFVEEGYYDAVINCTGLGSRYIVPDEKVFPTRGQVARVDTPWLTYCFFCGPNYIIPNNFNVVLGGTGQANDYNLNVCPKDSKIIFEGCKHIVPGLQNSHTLFEWVGLRPSREGSVCVEQSDIQTKDKTVVIIHNYGHGGSGVTLFWGCAGEVLGILKGAIGKKTRSKL